MALTIDRLQETDLNAVMLIEQACFSHPWKRQFFLADLNRPTSYLLAARDDGQLLGYAVVWRTEDELHLANIAVSSEFRRQGIGSRLLDAVIQIGQDLHCSRVYLEVRVSNLPGQEFYRRRGFFQTHIRRQYYPDEDALVFEREL